MSRCDAAFKRDVLFACYDALESIGFTRYRKEDLDWPLHDGFHCWIGLNNGLYPDQFTVNPCVGLHVVQIAKLWRHLNYANDPSIDEKTRQKRRKHRRQSATYAVNLRHLVPGLDFIRFYRTTDVAAEAARLAGLYAHQGMDYARSIASYEQLLPRLESRLDMLGAYPEKYAVCLYFMGQISEARAFVESFVRKEPAYFTPFAESFLEMTDGMPDGKPS